MKYHFKIHKESDGFWAQGIELEGCFTQADTLEDLYRNMQEALNLYLQETANSKDLAPLPNASIKITKTTVAIPVNPTIAFAFLMRYLRISKKLTQQEVARRIGFDKIWSYQRLESGKCNPTLTMLSRIKEVFPELSVDYTLP